MFDEGLHTYKSDLELGKMYRDSGTGIEGKLVAIHLYEHACERGTIRYVNGMGEAVEASFDAPEMVLVESGVHARAQMTGGPARSEGKRR